VVCVLLDCARSVLIYQQLLLVPRLRVLYHAFPFFAAVLSVFVSVSAPRLHDFAALRVSDESLLGVDQHLDAVHDRDEGQRNLNHPFSGSASAFMFPGSVSSVLTLSEPGSMILKSSLEVKIDSGIRFNISALRKGAA